MSKPPRPVLIESPKPEGADAVLSRLKRQQRPDGLLQCPRCGCRDVIAIENGVIVRNGRKQRGTRIVKDACALCWKAGATIQMVPGGQGPKLVR